jgi:hypothetical protein
VKIMASNHIHPRKLYELIRACPTFEARGKAAFQFLSACTASSCAYLFLCREAQLALCESTASAASVPGLAEEAERSWRGDIRNESDRTKTVDIASLAMTQQPIAASIWHSEDGQAFDRSILGVYRSDAWISVGIFMFRPSELSSPQSIRAPHIGAICNALIDAGDVTPGLGAR